jgi:hypothetical protein
MKLLHENQKATELHRGELPGCSAQPTVYYHGSHVNATVALNVVYPSGIKLVEEELKQLS